MEKRPASKQENEEDPKRTKLTEENITTHQALLKEEHSDPKKVGELIKLLPPGEQQLLWKKFEKSRISASADGDYKDVTKGTGSQVARKRNTFCSEIGRLMVANWPSSTRHHAELRKHK